MVTPTFWLAKTAAPHFRLRVNLLGSHHHLILNNGVALQKSRTFGNMGLKPELVDALSGLGITEPTEIQRLSIKNILKSKKKNFFLNAQTGSGKTMCYILPIIQGALDSMEESKLQKQLCPSIFAIVLVPNRTLATQVCAQIAAIVSKMQTAAVVPVTNLHDIPRHIRTVFGPAKPIKTVYVATPVEADRLIRGSKKIYEEVRITVADEADLLLKDFSHFKSTRNVIHALLGKAHLRRREESAGRAALDEDTNSFHIQFILSGATLQTCEAIAEITIPRLHRIGASSEVVSLPKKLLERFVEEGNDGDSMLLNEILKEQVNGMQTALVFVRSCDEASRIAALAKATPQVGKNIDLIEFHSGIDREKREEMLIRATLIPPEGRMRSLVIICTDMLTRGVDLPRVTHVFQRMRASDATVYLHRVGRTGRVGGPKVAVAVALVASQSS